MGYRFHSISKFVLTYASPYKILPFAWYDPFNSQIHNALMHALFLSSDLLLLYCQNLIL